MAGVRKEYRWIFGILARIDYLCCWFIAMDAVLGMFDSWDADRGANLAPGGYLSGVGFVGTGSDGHS